MESIGHCQLLQKSFKKIYVLCLLSSCRTPFQEQIQDNKVEKGHHHNCFMILLPDLSRKVSPFLVNECVLVEKIWIPDFCLLRLRFFPEVLDGLRTLRYFRVVVIGGTSPEFDHRGFSNLKFSKITKNSPSPFLIRQSLIFTSLKSFGSQKTTFSLLTCCVPGEKTHYC